MPAADAAQYELAFHVLPTVAEGEVAEVCAALKAAIEKADGAVTGEEEPKRFELAYEIVKHLEGRNRKFTSAYFGWVRFTLEPSKIEELTEQLDGMNQLLRHLLIRLNKMEAANPFMFHESLTAEQAAMNEEEDASEDEEDTDTENEATDGEEAAEEVK